jgi:hypothetical protein
MVFLNLLCWFYHISLPLKCIRFSLQTYFFHYVSQTDLKLMILLPQPPDCRITVCATKPSSDLFSTYIYFLDILICFSALTAIYLLATLKFILLAKTLKF